MTKTNYDQLENFQKNWKKIEKSSVNPIAAFDHNYMKSTLIQFKSQKKNKIKIKVHPLNFEKVFNWTQRKTWSDLSE